MDGNRSPVGARRAVLNDLSPAVIFIAHVYTHTPHTHTHHTQAFQRESQRVLKEVEDELSWMDEMEHKDDTRKEIFYRLE